MTADFSRQWPSLADQIDVAEVFYGRSGQRSVAAWLDGQLSFVGNDSFAAQFSDHIDLPGINPADYAHRRIRTRTGELIGGIRFYGRDIGRPFVEVVAHSFDDLDSLTDVVAREWSAFAPPLLRLRTAPGRLRGPGVGLDVTIHAGRCREMADPDGRVELDRFDDVEEALELIDARYADLAAQQPELAANLSRPDRDDIRGWHAGGDLWAIHAAGATVGLLAIARDAVDWLDGYEVQDEVTAKEYSGRGYATSAQALWGRRTSEHAPEGLVIGTIDRHNHASRATAVRAGRPRVLDDVFVVASAATTSMSSQWE